MEVTRGRRLLRVLACAAMLVVGTLLVTTVESLDKSSGAVSGGEPVVGEVQECERHGPIGADGIGYYWHCRVLIRGLDGAGEEWIGRSVVTPADIGAQVRLRENCGTRQCTYGQPTLWVRVLLVMILSIAWWLFALVLVGVGLIELGAAIVGPRVIERWSARKKEASAPELEGRRLVVETADAAGLTMTFRYPESVALYAAARPIVRIDGVPTTVTWQTHSFPLAPGKHQVEVVVVAYDAPLHTSRASADVMVPRQRGVAITYEAPTLG